MNITLLLADYASIAEGKLTVVGAGWTLTGPMPAPSAIGALIEIPWTETNAQHHVSFWLEDEDGAPVIGADGQPVRVEADFEVGRPPGVPAGTEMTVPLAFNVAPIALKPGSRFVWGVTLDDQSKDEWRRPFATRAGAWPQAA